MKTIRTFEVNGNEYKFKCRKAYGLLKNGSEFRHYAKLSVNGIHTNGVCQYWNRTWERFDFDTVIKKVDDITLLNEKFQSISVLVNRVSLSAINFTVAAITLVPVESFTTPLILRLVCAAAP
jgi:hypothetical protein